MDKADALVQGDESVSGRGDQDLSIAREDGFPHRGPRMHLARSRLTMVDDDPKSRYR